MNEHSILYKFKIIQNLIDITSTNNSKINGSKSDAIYIKHLIQKIIHLGTSEFLTDKNFNRLIQKNKVKTNNFKISRKSGFESVSYLLIIKSLIQFILLWFSVFLYYFVAFIFFKNTKVREKIIIFGVEHLDFNDNEVISNFIYFTKKHIKVKDNYDVLISSNNYKTLRFQNFIVRKNPHSYIINSGLKVNDFLNIQLLHLSYFFIFIKNIFSDRRSAILAKDFALISLFDFANQRKLIKSIVFTNSNMNYQPIWSSNYIDKNFSTSMFWYSENSCPVVSDVSNNKKYFNQYHPYLSLLSIDNHFVWTKFFKKTLSKFTSFENCYVIGPILWKEINNNILCAKNNEKKIIVFDVTPVSNKWQKDNGYSDVFYTYKNMKKFILDIVECRNTIKSLSGTKIIVKPKRLAGDFHDKDYGILLKRLEFEKQIEILHTSDIDLVVKNSSLVICVPFTSPLILAKYLNKKCFYYDSTASLIPYDGHDQFLIKGKKSLYKELSKINNKVLN